MIVEFFCNIVFGLLNFLIGLFPSFPSFESLNVSLAPVFYVARLVNVFLPLGVVSSCLLIVLFVYNVKFVWSILMWIIKKIPGVS